MLREPDRHIAVIEFLSSYRLSDQRHLSEVQLQIPDQRGWQTWDLARPL